MFIPWNEKGLDPPELTGIHVRSVGFNHPTIHVVYFEEDRFKGFLFYEEAL
jgi:hypothetical protein